MTIAFDHVGILSSTPEQNTALAAFFADVLGLPVDDDAAGGYAEVTAGHAVIALHVGSRLGRTPTPHGGTLLQMTTDDVDAEIARVRERGGTVVAEPEDMPWGRSAYVAGPHGVLVELYRP